METLILLSIGLIVALFVGLNVGGSSTGVCFGPLVGSDLLSIRQASSLMFIFAIMGGVIVGPNVVETMGEGLIPPSYFTLSASIAVLFFTGLSLVLSNYLKISASTSQIAVIAIVGMGIALGVLNWRTFGIILVWWIISAIIAFWIAVFVGRYIYDEIVELIDLSGKNSGNLSELIIIGVGCYMAFSAGASNVANVIAPLVGSGYVDMYPGVILSGIAVGIGGFIIGPRTMQTIGHEITDMTLEAALLVEIIAASIITALSWLGIPASLAIVATLAVMGLGWGRATRRVPLSREIGPEKLRPKDRQRIRTDALDLYNIDTSRRVVITWIVAPILAGLLALITFYTALYLNII